MKINQSSSSIYIVIIILTLFTFQSQAWLPGEHREIYANDGSNLFNNTVLPSSTTTASNFTSPSNMTRKRWLPANGKIRGVNLGSLFVFEPWLASTEWSKMGCAGQVSEFDCVSALGQDLANVVFQNHWNTWITQDDIAQIQSYGLNTIRIPVGYWMKQDLVYSSEYFPQGAIAYLERLCGWASDAGFYIIIDLHGAPGAQVATNPDTGQYAPSPGFYVWWQYSRVESFLSWLTTMIHTDPSFRNVGMIGILNEPVQDANAVSDMLSEYYPNAYASIRNAESALGITTWNSLHVQMMNEQWGSGDPTEYLPEDAYFVAYDDHRYLKWDSSVPVSQAAYINDSCSNDRGNNDNNPTIVGEFSLSVPDSVQWTSTWDPSTQQAFYTTWFAAQVSAYESFTTGWIFWTWKSQLGDYRWSYQDAVAAGVIPSDFSHLQANSCVRSA